MKAKVVRYQGVVILCGSHTAQQNINKLVLAVQLLEALHERIAHFLYAHIAGMKCSKPCHANNTQLQNQVKYLSHTLSQLPTQTIICILHTSPQLILNRDIPQPAC